MAQRAEIKTIRPNRIPPHNLDAEQSVLGAMLESRDAVANVLEAGVQTEDFYKPAHAEIFDAILAIFNRSERPDALTLAEELNRRGSLEEVGGKPYITGLLEAYPTASSATRYARIVEEHARLRRLITAGGEISELGFSIPEDVDQAVDQAEEIVYQVADRRLRDTVQPLKGLLSQSMIDLEKLYERGESITGTGSGFADLDDMTSGFQPSNLIMVAARPSMGKCLAADTEVVDASTGEPMPISRFVAERRPSIFGIGTDGDVSPREVTDWIPNGRKQCFRLVTRTGRTIEATDNHPFFTIEGWTPLSDLRPGQKVAVPRTGRDGTLPAGNGYLPPETWILVEKACHQRSLSLAELSRRAGEDMSNVHTNRGLSSLRLRKYAEILNDDDLRWLSNPDLYWDAVVSIEPVGEKEVFDLTVPDGNNFVAEDIVVHNSALLGDFALHVAVRERRPVVIFNLEMSRYELTKRFMSSEARVDSQRIAKGTLQEQDWARLGAAVGRLAEAPIYIDDSANITLMEIRAKCRRIKAREKNLGLVIIDYLQLMQSPRKSENRQQEVSEISRNLKILARELEIPVVCAAQLNRSVEYRADKRPLLGDLRESGSLEQDSDLVMFIYRDEVYNPDTEARGEAELLVAKHRNGPTGTVRLAFMNQYTKFASLARSAGL